MKIFILSILPILMIACSAPEPTKSPAPVDEELQLVGRWEGTYSRNYSGGEILPALVECDMWIEFTDTSFYFSCFDPSRCGPWGGGKYHLSENNIKFVDMMFRLANCEWGLSINGDFQFTYDPGTGQLNMNSRLRDFFYEVEITKVSDDYGPTH